MRRPGIAIIVVLLSCLACSGPAVIPTRNEGAFELGQLRGASVAIWPIGKVVLLGAVPETVAEAYGTPERFAAQLSLRLGEVVMPNVKAGSLRPADIERAFHAKELQELLTPPPKLDGTIEDSGLGFTEETLAAYVRKLRAQPMLEGVRYVLLPHNLNIARGWSSMKHGGGAGTMTSADTTARLRVVVLDLPGGKVVWEGKVIASESSTFMKTKALHDVEKKLVQHLGNAVIGVTDRL